MVLSYKPRLKRIIVIPSTLFIKDNEPIKTFKVGQLARWCSIFRVERIIIYQLDEEYRNGIFLKNILEYIETPQYLRKYLFPKKKIFRNVGVLPPLRTLSHGKIHEFKKIKYKDGLVLNKVGRNKYLVYVGEEEPVVVVGKPGRKKRVVIKITSSGMGRIIDRHKVPYYWGYTVSMVENIFEALKLEHSVLKIGTSRLGDDIRKIYRKILRIIQNKRYNAIAFYFGSYDKGLLEIIGDRDPKNFFDIFVNLVPFQATKTVRTEEAVPIALSIFNILIS